MKEVFRSFFSLSSQERKGIILLSGIMLVIIFINAFLGIHRPFLTKEEDSLFIEDLKDFESQLIVQHDSIIEKFPVFKAEDGKPGELFPFDPNSSSAGDLRRLGIDNRMIRTWLNYRLHGGRFRQKEDIKKLYGMNSGLYERLAPYVYIKESMPGDGRISSEKYLPYVTININRADPVELEKLPGIGPILSKRIIRYRNLLGGFYDTGQLNEVYGLSDSLVLAIKNRLYADTSTIVRLSLNTVTEYELARHPYIGKYIARGIVSYRLKVQKINNPDELKTNGLVSAEAFERLKKYLTI